MTNEVVIEIRIRLPDGVVPDVAYGEAVAPVVAEAVQMLSKPVAASLGVPEPSSAFPPFATPSEFWSVGSCPKHQRPWKNGKFGPFCSAQDDSGPKGYCVLKPGDIWNGKGIPLLTAAA